MRFPIVACVTCTYNRHTLLERVARCFIDQDYEGKHYWIVYNNSPISIDLDYKVETLDNKIIIIVNNSSDRETKSRYSDVGSIFRDALSYIPEEVEIVTFMDDDDLYLPNHISEGARGIEMAHIEEKVAYKPYFSYFRYMGDLTIEHNTMEPSIFVDNSYLKDKGFRKTTVDYHQEWIDPLIQNGKILVEKSGIPTFIYDWNGDTGAFKISGGNNNKEHFNEHKYNSRDTGDRIITPISEIEISKYYKLVK